jgi:hypothetical protein
VKGNATWDEYDTACFTDARCETTAMMLAAAAMTTTASAPTASAILARRLNRRTGSETSDMVMAFLVEMFLAPL